MEAMERVHGEERILIYNKEALRNVMPLYFLLIGMNKMGIMADRYLLHLRGNLRLMRHYPEEAIYTPFFRTKAKLPNKIAPNYRIIKVKRIT